MCSFLLNACSTFKEITPEEARSLKERKITLTKHIKPKFGVLTRANSFGILVGGAVGGVISSLGMDETVSVMRQDFDDPAIDIANNVIKNISVQYAMTNTDDFLAIDNEENEEYSQKLVNASKKSDVVIDIKTIYWGVNPSKISFTNYNVYYTSRLRLVDAKKTKVIADEICSVPDEFSFKTTLDELLKDDAIVMREELKRSSKYCTNLFLSKIFMIKESME